jgi:hypothetical protein
VFTDQQEIDVREKKKQTWSSVQSGRAWPGQARAEKKTARAAASLMRR